MSTQKSWKSLANDPVSARSSYKQTMHGFKKRLNYRFLEACVQLAT